MQLEGAKEEASCGNAHENHSSKFICIYLFMQMDKLSVQNLELQRRLETSVSQVHCIHCNVQFEYGLMGPSKLCSC